MNKKINIAIVGAGTYVTKAHIPTYLKSKYSVYIGHVSIFNRTQKKAQDILRKFKLNKAYYNFEELLNDNTIDMISVVTSDKTHFNFTKRALENNKNVFVEKPLTTDIREGEVLTNLAKESNLLLGVDFHKRLDPFHIEAKNFFCEKVGDLQTGYVWMQDTIDVPTSYISKETAEGSSPIWFLGIHMFDLISWITALKPTFVQAQSYQNVLYKKGIKTFDSFKVSVTYENGGVIDFHLSWILPKSYPSLVRQGLYLMGTKGCLEVDSQNRGAYYTNKEAHNSANPLFIYEDIDGNFNGYGIDSIGLFCEKVYKKKNGLKTNNISRSYEEFKTATLIAHAAYESIRTPLNKSGGSILGSTIPLSNI